MDSIRINNNKISIKETNETISAEKEAETVDNTKNSEDIFNFDDIDAIEEDITANFDFVNDVFNLAKEKGKDIDATMNIKEHSSFGKEERSMSNRDYENALDAKQIIEEYKDYPETCQNRIDTLTTELDELNEKYDELQDKLDKMDKKSPAYGKNKTQLTKIKMSITQKERELSNAKKSIEDIKEYSIKKQEELNNIIENMEISNFNDVKDYAAITESADKVYDKTVNSLAENKDNTEYVENFVDSMLANLNNNYDSKISHAGINGSNAEKLMQFVNNTDEVDGAICETIHGLAADMLNEAGIPAVVVHGFMEIDGKNGHATLLYKSGDKYVWNNYGNSEAFEADNIEDAFKIISKNNNYFSSNGYLNLQSDDGSFRKVLYTEEAAFGDKLDKSTTDKQNIFAKTNIENDNSITYSTNDYNITKTTENINSSAGTTKISQQSYSIQTKAEKDTKSFAKSDSTGFDANLTTQYKHDSNTITKNTDITFSSINDSTELNQQYFAINSSLTGSKKIINTENTDISVLGNIGAFGAFAMNEVSNYGKFSHGDFRFSNDLGVEIQNQVNNVEITNQASIGMPLDFDQKGYKQEINFDSYGISAGLNLKGSSELNYKPTQDLNLSANVNGFYSKTKHFEHTGYSAEIGAEYKTNDTNIFAKLGIEQEKEEITINKFDETIKNSTELTSSIGFSKDNTELTGTVSYDLNKKKAKGSLSAKIKFD